MKQEDDDHEAYDDRLFEEFALQRIDGCLDQPRAIVAGDNFDAGREAAANFRYPRLDAVDDVERVLPVAHHDDTADGLPFAVPFGNSLSQVGPKAHDAEVAHQHGNAVASRDGNLFEVGE